MDCNGSHTVNTAGIETVCTQIAVLYCEHSRYRDCVYSNSGLPGYHAVQLNDFVQTFRTNMLHAPEQNSAIMKWKEAAT